jgi:hypothetical protein
MKIASVLSGRINYPIILLSVFSLIGVALLAGAAAAPSSAQATASPCIMVTGSDAKTVSVTGSAKITASDCAIAVLSQAAPAISLTGSSKVTASTVCAKSASTAGSSKIMPNADASCASGNDPFALEQEPAVGECTYTNLSYTNSSSNTLHPGVYCGNTTLAGSTKNTFAPGVYIFKDGVLKIEGSSHVSGAGVVLFFTGTGSALSVGGSAKLSITAPASGTLKGFAIYLDPASHPAAQSSLSGSSQMTLQGITYLPNQKMVIDGSSKIIASTLATFVVKGLELNGSSNLQAIGALPSGPAPDTAAPVIAPHDDVTAIGSTAGANVSYTAPTSTDDIDGSVAVSCTPASGSLFPLGTTEIDCSAHDAAGNTATSHFNVIVSLPPDTQAPVIEAHNDIMVGGDLSGASVPYTAPAATDDVDTSVAVSCSPASGSVFAFGTTTVTCNAQDSAGNQAIPTAFNVLVVDQVAPVIAPHEDISVVGNSLGATVSYTNPTATDNVDTNVAVSCSPASGSMFTVGSTTVLCNAQDAAGNVAEATSFTVVVTVPPPVPFTMATQSDESFLCSPDWENCFTEGFGFINIPLGLGSNMGTGTLLSVTIAKDENSPFVSNPWIIQFECFTDAGYTTHCPDWVQGNSWNGFRPYLISESATTTADNKHWSAYFLNPSHETNSDGSLPIVFRPEYYYRLIINDNGWNIGAYGTTTPQVLPYYVINGMTL